MPAFMPAAIAMFTEFGAGAVGMTAVLDHGSSALGNRRRGDGERASAAMT